MRQLSLFDEVPDDRGGHKLALAELFAAYFECRRNKRNTSNALA